MSQTERRLREVLPEKSPVDPDDQARLVAAEVERVRRIEPKFDYKGRCRASGKRPYKTKLTALLSNADRPVIARAYKCEFCGRWHLTRKRQ